MRKIVTGVAALAAAAAATLFAAAPASAHTLGSNCTLPGYGWNGYVSYVGHTHSGSNVTLHYLDTYTANPAGASSQHWLYYNVGGSWTSAYLGAIGTSQYGTLNFTDQFVTPAMQSYILTRFTRGTSSCVARTFV